MKNSLKSVNAALALHAVHCAVDNALRCVMGPAEIAACICEATCHANAGDMVAHIKRDDNVPETVAPWLIKLYELLDREEADQACQMVYITLQGYAIEERIADIENL